MHACVVNDQKWQAINEYAPPPPPRGVLFFQEGVLLNNGDDVLLSVLYNINIDYSLHVYSIHGMHVVADVEAILELTCKKGKPRGNIALI